MNRILCLLTFSIGLAPSVFAAQHGVVLVYHHVATDTPASTSVTPTAFAAHLDLLDELGFSVWTLGKLAQHLRAGKDVPDRVVALTFDDASASLPASAIPMLAARGWPFTLFVNTQAIGVQQNVMTWAQLRDAIAAGAEIGNHSHEHKHWVASPAPALVRADIERAQQLLNSHLQVQPTLVAYPYGEYSKNVQAVVADLQLLGVSQQSGALGHRSDFLAIPRFPVATGFDDLQNLRLKLLSKPLYLEADPPQGSVFLTARQPISIQQRVGTNLDMQQLTCYQGGSKVRLDTTAKGWRFFLRTPEPGRHKVNCTAPDREVAGRYGWWSYLGMRIDAEMQAAGKWYPD